MSTVARAAYRALAVLFLVGVVAEFFLAGLGVFRTMLAATPAGSALTTVAFDAHFHPHLVLGDLLFGVSLLLLVAALLARLGRPDVLTAGGLFVLLCVQATFAFTGPAAVRALHPTLALAVLGAGVGITLRAFRPAEPSGDRDAVTCDRRMAAAGRDGAPIRDDS